MIQLVSSSITGLTIKSAQSGTVILSSSIPIPSSYTLIFNDSNIGTFKVQVTATGSNTEVFVSGNQFVSPTVQVSQSTLTYFTPTVSTAATELTVISASATQLIISASNIPSSSYTVSVVSTNGTIVTSSFTKPPGPQILSVSTNATFGSANKITLIVSGYTNDAVVLLNSSPASILSASDVPSSSNKSIVLSQSLAALGYGEQSLQVSNSSGQTAVYKFIANQLASSPVLSENFESGWSDIRTSSVSFSTSSLKFVESFDSFWILPFANPLTYSGSFLSSSQKFAEDFDSNWTGTSDKSPLFTTSSQKFVENFDIGWQPLIDSIQYQTGTMSISGLFSSDNTVYINNVLYTGQIVITNSNNTMLLSVATSSLLEKQNNPVKIVTPGFSDITSSFLYSSDPLWQYAKVDFRAYDTSSYSGSGTIWYDLSINKTNATLFNSPVFSTSSGGFFTFSNNNNTYGSFSRNNLPYGGSARTIITWVRPEAPPSWSNKWVVAYGKPGLGQAMYLGLAGIYNSIAAHGDDVNDGQHVINNVWMQLVGTYDGTTAKVYKNGVLVGSGNKSWNTVSDASYDAYIGKGLSYENWTGGISRVSIYNKVLTVSEILEDFQSNRTKYGI